MNRRIVYSAQIPLSADFLQSQKDTLQALGQLAQDLMTGPGTQALLVGLACTPTNPPSMSVNLGPGSVYQQGALDGTAFGSLQADATSVFQQGFSTATQNLGGFAAPSAPGQSIAYLVQVQFQQVDARPLVLTYYNSANPQVPLVGLGGSGSSQNTDRTGFLAVQVVAGAAAATGSQIPPNVTAGWLPAYVVTVTTGQTTIGAMNVSPHPQAPFLASLTSRHHLGLPGTAPKINLALEVEGSLPGGTGFSFGQGLKAAADGTIVLDYAGTGSDAHPAHSNHTHANDATIGGPYQAQGNYALAGHHHASGDIDNVPWPFVSGTPAAGAIKLKSGLVAMTMQNGQVFNQNVLNTRTLGFTQTPVIVASVRTGDDGTGMAPYAFALNVSNEDMIVIGQIGFEIQSVPANFNGQIWVSWIAIGA